jgi:hypothetical protein
MEMLWPGEDEDELRNWNVKLSREHAGWMEPKEE